VDRDTVTAYEGSAGYYAAERRAYQPERAAAFAASVSSAVGPTAVRLDLGSGPGHYLPLLGRPVVAADPAVAMLVEARRHHPDTAAVACEVGALPFRRGALGGVWASKSLQHVPAGRLPLALCELHRVLPVDGVLDVTVFDRAGRAGDAGAPDDSDEPGHAEVTGDDDDIPGRLFTLWGPRSLAHVLTGAGFLVDEVAATGGDGSLRKVVARARRGRTLSDTVGPGMRLLACGLNPSLYAADAGVGFARPGNRFWPAALAAGVATADRDPRAALRDHGLGMTDIVKRATVAAAELTREEYRQGLERIGWLVRWLRPGAVCFVGLAGWRAAVDRRARPGVQPDGIEGVPVYVMPSTSGLNASSRLDDLVGHLRAAADLADLHADR
jgi:double-stranded uracil-DNA glycosylase